VARDLTIKDIRALAILSSNQFITAVLILIVLCSIAFQNLPNEIYPNMLDLYFGFNGLEVQKTFEVLGETGRTQYIYSSLILDSLFPLLYVLLLVSIFLRLNERRALYLCLPCVAGLFDIGENILISMMMSSSSFGDISSSQIFLGSLFNQCKWSLCLCSVMFIIYKLTASVLKREA
tara:strand:- start:197 stop:727 length:531 start_codon:yes stop_codon:yes gene_type:complete